MDTDKQFHIFQEDCGTYLRLTIPGQNRKNSIHVRWDKSMLHDTFVIPKSERAALTRRFEKEGFLSHLNSQEIKKLPSGSGNYTVSKPWNMDGTNPNNWRIFEQKAFWELVNSLWRPLYHVLSDNADKFTYIEYDHPVLPQVVEMPFVDSWYAANQKEGAFLQKVTSTAGKTTIISIHKPNEIILKIKNHSFEHHPSQRFQIYPTKQTVTPVTLCDEELAELKQQVLHRDSYLLSGLTNSERKRLSRHQSCPMADGLQLHWVQWLYLGGSCHKANAIVVTPDTALKYRTTVQRPFEAFWEQHGLSLQATGKPIHLEVPVPMTTYRNKTLKTDHLDPDKRRHINRQERRYLNHMAQRMGDYEYGDK